MASEKPKVDERWLRDTARLAGIDLDETRIALLLPIVERLMENNNRLDELGLFDKEPSHIFRFGEDE